MGGLETGFGFGLGLVLLGGASGSGASFIPEGSGADAFALDAVSMIFAFGVGFAVPVMSYPSSAAKTAGGRVLALDTRFSRTFF